jgi:hypothetical protein
MHVPPPKGEFVDYREPDHKKIPGTPYIYIIITQNM